MKNIIFSLAILLASNLSAQEPQQLWNNFFKTDGNQLYWQNVSETSLNAEELVIAIKTSGFFEDVDATNPQIICKLKPYNVPYKNYGFGYMVTPFYISKNMLTATCIFELKDNRMRSTIKSINFINNENDPFGGAQGNIGTFEEWVLNGKGEIKESFFIDGSNILNQDFVVRTTFVKMDSDW